MKIIDLTAKAEIKEKKFITLEYRLSKITGKDYIKTDGTVVLDSKNIIEIICIDKNQEYKDDFFDVIYIKYDNDNNYMFLGHWNDGIL